MEGRRNSAEGIKGEGKRGRNVGGKKRQGRRKREGEGKGGEEGTFLMLLASFNIYI